MSLSLNIGRLIRASYTIAPLLAGRRGFGTLLVIGDSDVFMGAERLRAYTTLDAVAEDFGTSAPEYLAAQLYYSQSPKPLNLMVGRWFQSGGHATLFGAALSASEQALANFTSLTDGSISITTDGGAASATAIDLSAATSLTSVASLIDTALNLAANYSATFAWDALNDRFWFSSEGLGAAGTLSFASGTTGTNLATLLKLTSATGAELTTPGVVAETAVACVTELADQSQAWYGCMFAAGTMPDEAALIAVAGFIEGATPNRIFGISSSLAEAKDALVDDDIGSQIVALGYKRTAGQYSPNAYAMASMFGRAFSVNFSASLSMITLMYKQEPGLVPQGLSETQAQTLKAKRYNVLAAYSNATAILQYGTMFGSAYFDEIHGLDWFIDAIQTKLYNRLYGSTTKIPQTDSGQNILVTDVVAVCDEAVNNGLCAPGTWNSDGFGQLATGQFLKTGYYVWTPPMATQDQSIREQRIAPPIQVALKLAGAIHEVDVLVSVNR